MLWRYRPENNRTPKIHPIIGGLVWDQVYDNPACANDPDFVPVEAEQADTSAGRTPADSPDAPSAPAAGKPGRSK